MSGIILGMTRTEVTRRFDDIVAFSGVEPFLDTPIKWYSSGMQLRLGFAVTAHLEAEILLIDEVLAVGDAAFQKKCVGKMREVASDGRTVLFISHDMASINDLCNRAIWLDKGRVRADSTDVKQVTQGYLAASGDSAFAVP
jgi:lipopolysaccharide transport system ATP-binding protein